MERIEYLRRGLDNKRIQSETRKDLSIFDGLGAGDEPLPIRKAKAIDLMLREAPIHIYPRELIVGTSLRETHGTDDPSVREVPPQLVSGEGYMDFSNSLREKGLADETYHPVIRSLERYGCSTTWGILPHYATPEEVAEARRYGLDENSNPGHMQVGNHRVIAYGWIGLRGMAQKALDDLDKDEDSRRQSTFLRSVIISLEAAQRFALRYSELAEETSRTEEDPERRLELRRISEVCRNVTVRAPATWWEALQILWFNHLISKTQGAHQLGRFDQYMWPVLEGQLRRGEITMEEAQELLECLWIKFASLTDYTMDNLQNLILGGQTPTGEDATNPLSYMCMEATDRLEVIDPKWSMRVHGESPEEFLTRAAEQVKRGRIQPGIYNDEIIIRALRRAGVPLEDARDYTNDGCSEILVQGRSNPWAFEGKVKLLKCLEKTTRRLLEYESFEELMRALRAEISVGIIQAVHSTNLVQRNVPRISPNPWVSSSVEGCIEKGMDVTEGGAKYNYSAITATGLADTADSLAAMKKLVYEERRVSRQELVQTLEGDFVGHERLRQMLLNQAPKFGNDDDYVDSIAAQLVKYTAAEVTKHRNPRGGNYILGLFTYGEYIGHGMTTGATPDGRRAGQWISPNFSPSPGRDRKGPYATMLSTVKVDQSLTASGSALDLMLHPTSLAGPGGVGKLVSLLRAFNRLGGTEVQFNIVNGETLRAAQLEPEKYRNITVRLWGFPAYFTQLPREFQDHIIARTEHTF